VNVITHSHHSHHSQSSYHSPTHTRTLTRTHTRTHTERGVDTTHLNTHKPQQKSRKAEKQKSRKAFNKTYLWKLTKIPFFPARISRNTKSLQKSFKPINQSSISGEIQTLNWNNFWFRKTFCRKNWFFEEIALWIFRISTQKVTVEIFSQVTVAWTKKITKNGSSGWKVKIPIRPLTRDPREATNISCPTVTWHFSFRGNPPTSSQKHTLECLKQS